MNTHRIRSQRWLIQAPSPEAAFALRTQLRQTLDDSLLPGLSAVLDSAAGADEILHIPRLELHLRISDSAGLAMRLPDELRAALARYTSAPTAAATAPKQSPQAGRQLVLTDYLASGHVAWHAPQETHAALLAWLRDAAAGLTRPDLQHLLLTIRVPEQQSACLLRLRSLLSAAAWQALLAHRSAPPEPAWLATLANLAGAADTASADTIRLQAMYLALSLSAEAGAPVPATPPPALRQALQAAGLSVTPQATAAPAAVPAAAGLPPGSSCASSPPADAHAVSADTAAPRPTPRTAAAAVAGDHPGTRRQPLPAAPQAQARRASHAGLILLHPFLPQLLAATGITTGDTRQIAAAQLPRAAALLHWLASGRHEAHEFELDLIKVMLGHTPDLPLPPVPGLLQADERAEADALLVAAIGHWPALGRTRPAALRQTFLQRDGLLRDSSQGWLLQLQPQPFDHLLARLPWAISLVKLPWMTRPICTDWPTP